MMRSDQAKAISGLLISTSQGVEKAARKLSKIATSKEEWESHAEMMKASRFLYSAGARMNVVHEDLQRAEARAFNAERTNTGT